jgi:hypothetical protein
MSEDEHERVPRVPAGVQTGANQRRAYPAPLEGGRYRDRSKGDCIEGLIGVNGDRSKKNMTDDRPSIHSDQRDHRPVVLSKPVNQLSLFGSPEGGEIDYVHAIPVPGLFPPNLHRHQE